MAEVSLMVAGRSHTVQCRDGEEPHLRMLGDMLNRHSEIALRASGGQSSERTMLLIALLIADQLAEAEQNPPTGIPPMLLDRLADRLESVAAALEEAPAAS